MDVRVKFFGGAQTVTGSKYLLEIDNNKLLIDCGLFQGLKALRLRNWDDFPMDVAEIDAILLTHAHIDHSGYIPRLVKQGFDGPIYCTKATYDLLEILWMDSAKLQEEEAEFAKEKGYSKHKNPLALYDRKDVQAALPLLKPVAYEKPLSLFEGAVTAHFHNAGHILGSAIIALTLNGTLQQKRMIFSGDLGRQNDPILLPPATFSEADIAFIESTYGDRDNPLESPMEELAEQINAHIHNGVILIPAFTVGRTQSLMIYLFRLFESGKIPKVPVYIDSPMAVSVTQLYKQHRSNHKMAEEEADVFQSDHFHYYREQTQSNSLKGIKKEAIIISASGMCTGGRILNHLFHRLSNPQDLVLFVGYQAEGTRGADILNGESTIKIYGEEIEVKCHTAMIKGLSAHADKNELLEWYNHLKDSPKFTFIVHGERNSALSFQKRLTDNGHTNVVVPEYLESFQLFESI